MNSTVKRIVDILFQDAVENDETRALHEEVMNNCQEHYDDLIARGIHSRFTVRRKDAVVLDLPVIVLVLGLLCAFRACVLLLVIGLFAGCRYNVGDKEVAEPASEPVAEV